MENSERGPERLRSPTPMMSLTWDAGEQNRASGTVAIQGQEWTTSRDSIGPEAKARKDRRARSEAKAERGRRAERGQRAASVMEGGNAKGTNPVSQESGHQTENGRCPIGP